MNNKCLSMDVVGTSKFIGMPLSAQALYIHLVLRADENGKVNVSDVVRRVKATKEDISCLEGNGYIVADSGDYAILCDVLER